MTGVQTCALPISTVAQNRLINYNQTKHLALDELNSFKQSSAYQDILLIEKVFVSPLIRAQKTAEALLLFMLFIIYPIKMFIE